MNDVNIFSNEFCQNRHYYYKQLLKEGTIMFSPLSKCWLVVGYDDAKYILADHENFYLRPIFEEFDSFLGGTEHPEHTKNKAVIKNHFEALRKADFQESFLLKVEKVCQILRTRLEQKETFDLMREFIIPFSISTSLMIFELDNITQKYNLTDEKSNIDEVIEKLVRINSSLGYLESSHIYSLIKENESSMVNKFLNKINKLSEINTKYDHVEIIKTLRSLMVVGADSTMGLLSNSLHTLLTNNDILSKISEDSEKNLKLFIDESLRFHTSVQMTTRIALKDISFSNSSIKKGDVLAVLIGSANRDPHVFKNPDSFDITRLNNNLSLSYGRGVHFCMGYHVSKTIANIALKVILPLINKLELSKNNENYDHSPMIMKFSELNLKWK